MSDGEAEEEERKEKIMPCLNKDQMQKRHLG
jgi:hypothetical protein